MKAAVLEKINAPLAVGDVEPLELQSGQVLVRNIVSGICGSQLQEIAGNKGNAKFVPHLLGHEGCGKVEEIGPDVTRLKKGDKVVLHWRKGDGIESPFPTYLYKGKKMPSGKVTTFSEYSIVSENRASVVSEDIPNDFCALLGCSLSTALSTVEKEARVQKGERVLVVGLGGLGASFLKAAHLADAGSLVAVDVADKSAAAERLGATLFINIARQRLIEALGAGNVQDFDVIIETSGKPDSIEMTLPLLAPSGRYIMVGQPKPGEDILIKNAYHLFGGEGKMIKATQGGQFSPELDIPRYVELYRNGKLNINDLVSHRTTLEGINDAIMRMREGGASRVLIDIWQ